MCSISPVSVVRNWPWAPCFYGAWGNGAVSTSTGEITIKCYTGEHRQVPCVYMQKVGWIITARGGAALPQWTPLQDLMPLVQLFPGQKQGGKQPLHSSHSPLCVPVLAVISPVTWGWKNFILCLNSSSDKTCLSVTRLITQTTTT